MTKQLPNYNSHTFKNGATVVSLSPHGFKFNDGTESEAQVGEIVKLFNLERNFTKVSNIKGMDVNHTFMSISKDQRLLLKELCDENDIIIVPFPVLVALREAGVRGEFPNAIAFNATSGTMRLPPNEKVVDINNWSY